MVKENTLLNIIGSIKTDSEKATNRRYLEALDCVTTLKFSILLGITVDSINFSGIKKAD